MSQERLTAAESYEYADVDEDDEVDELDQPSSRTASASASNSRPPIPSRNSSANTNINRSPYHLPASEQLRGVANRIIFSRYYVGFYFVMMSLSLTTVVLSLVATHQRRCPPVAWHILEVIVNGLMVLEVGTRWTAYGKKYPLTPLNIIDLLLVLFCSITLILVFKSPCSEGTRQEEVLDTILLVIRNAVQFLRLGNILRRSGHSILNPPKPIDLSQARTASLALDLDLDLEDEEAVAERQLGRRTLAGGGGGAAGRGGYEPIFQDEEDALEGGSGRREEVRKGTGVVRNQGRENLNEEDEDMWDRMG